MKKSKKFLLLGVLLLIFTTLYTKYTSNRIDNEVSYFLENNDFMQYSLTEYIDYFSKNEYEIGYSVGIDYLKKSNGLYPKIDYYTDNAFGISALKNVESVHIHYSEELLTNNKIDPRTIFWLDNCNDAKLPLIYGIEWDDTYKEVKHKMGLNILNTSLIPYLRYINELSIRYSSDMIRINCSKIDIDYWLCFDDEGVLDQIIIWSYNSKQQ